VGVWLDRRPRWEELAALLEEAYRRTAPRKLVARLEGPVPPPATARGARRPRTEP